MKAFVVRRKGFLTRAKAFAVRRKAFMTRVKAFAVRRKAFRTPVTTLRDRHTPAKADGRDASDRLIQPLRSQAEGRALPYGEAAAQVSAASSASSSSRISAADV